MVGWLSMQVNIAWPAPCKRDQVIPCFTLKYIRLESRKLRIQWENTTSESALDETKTPYSLSHIRLKSKQSLEIWDHLSFHLLALGCFSFEMEKCGRTVFVWKQHFYANVVFKQTWIYPFIAKAWYWCNQRHLGDKMQSPENETNKWNKSSRKTAVHEAMKNCLNYCFWITQPPFHNRA